VTKHKNVSSQPRFLFTKKDGGHTDTFLSVFAGQGVPALLTFPYYTMIFKGDLFVLGAAV